jgi:hypothetical protein
MITGDLKRIEGKMGWGLRPKSAIGEGKSFEGFRVLLLK